MAVLIREGSLEEVIRIVDQIDEFAHKETVESLASRVDGKKSLILIAEDEGDLLGFKIGYQLDEHTFYSWFGGVSPLARNKGVAQLQLEAQEHWVREQGYKHLKVKSRNQFPAMLRLLLRNGYLIEQYENKEILLESRIHFIKQF
ncbi:GNAT family N-acetyltransferase [Vibrio sp. 99-70-13A1]|uniref:GNAT family N-acetyltransferase n=1 Tax=Vibrio sp. 99-70-13A1 TaxID=2607601 RepID=UPI0014935781|nr:GNAT family N-acetyltransferase [Vibrio sp. 99-70-13A1]NOH96181.1 GNAT family N-acetyltransferase [Vibrio sp. 99-70-13A1]